MVDRYILETQVPNEFVRKELRKNMTNLPMRWKSIATSNNLDELIKITENIKDDISGQLEQRKRNVYFISYARSISSKTREQNPSHA